MHVSNLDSGQLHALIMSGAHEVIRHRQTLNDINVFPVPDSDTGNNLAHTMQAILIRSEVGDSPKTTMSSIAQAALVGAQGNSGIIFAQYLHGLCEALDETAYIGPYQFAEAAQGAVSHAYEAIAHPVEGTIVTVIREWAQALGQQKDAAVTIHELFDSTVQVAREALKRTTDQLKVLRDAHVVDSGAAAFVYFLEGALHYTRRGELGMTDVALPEELIVEVHPEHNYQELTYRYCTEALISGSTAGLDEIRNALEALGDSLIVAGGQSLARVHIHTDQPARVMRTLRRFGQLVEQKADDMVRQQHDAHASAGDIALVTDSIADLPQELLDQHNIHQIPLFLNLNGTSYLDKVTITPDELYTELDLAESYPTSAQPNRAAVTEYLQNLLAHYDQAIVITVAAAQSGTHNLLKSVAADLSVEGKLVRVVDSYQNSGAQGLLVLKAAELIGEGASLNRVCDEVERLRARAKILVSVESLNAMVRSGRLGKPVGVVGKLVNLKPVVTLDEEGKGTIGAPAFSLKSAHQKMLSIVKKANAAHPITRYAVVHAHNAERAHILADQLTEQLGVPPIYMMDISTIVGMSAGVGSVAVAYISEGI